MKFLFTLFVICYSSLACAQIPCESEPDSLIDFGYVELYFIDDVTPYESSIWIDCFEEGTLVDELSFEICMSIEHSYMGDLEMTLTLPDSSKIVLLNNVGDNRSLGNPIDSNSDYNIGEHWSYCWSLSAEYESMKYSTGTIVASLSNGLSMIPGSYLPQSGIESLACTEPNGFWTLNIIDHLAIDNGSISGWSLELYGQEQALYNCDETCLNDTDLDSICDEFDNCVAISNFNQMDVDNNGIGDACDYEDEIGLAEYTEKVNSPILKIIDLLGRERDSLSSINGNQILFYIYEDGSVQKKVHIN